MHYVLDVNTQPFCELLLQYVSCQTQIKDNIHVCMSRMSLASLKTRNVLLNLLKN